MTAPGTNPNEGTQEGLRLELQREVAERKRLEEALRRAEQLYQRAIMGTGAVPYLYDFKSGTYTFMGEGITNLTGYGAHEINRSLWRQIIQESVMQGEAAGLTKEEASRRTLAGELRTWWCDMR